MGSVWILRAHIEESTLTGVIKEEVMLTLELGKMPWSVAEREQQQRLRKRGVMRLQRQ